jgi:hypothetical protein
MGNIGDPITTSIPVVGSSGPFYAADYNTIMTEVVARLTSKIPYSSLLSSSSFDLNGQSIFNASFITFLSTGVIPGPSPVNRIVVYSGDLWFVSPSGAVQITSGAAIAAASVGGIEGDYGGPNPAKLRYNAVGQRFEAYHNYSTNVWAKYRGLGIDIAAGNTSPNMAQLRYSGASTLTFTFPSTLPAVANKSVLTISDTGDIETNAVLTTDITFSGSASVKHGDRTKPLSLDGDGFQSGLQQANVWPILTYADGVGLTYVFTGVINTALVQLKGFNEGDRLKSVVVRVAHLGAPHGYQIRKHAGGALIPSTVVYGAGVDTITINAPTAFSGDDLYILKIIGTNGTSNYTGLKGIYDRP